MTNSGIQALPPATVRTLGAAQVLHDATAVVKELLDNGLDAHATSIAIEISSNTLDSIQVRDNGHGIPAVDRNLVARPHCTSKINTEADLRSIGGASLGFRGEALASIAEMSGSLTISTRVEGELVATALKINQRGDMGSQERASLPIGTTVKATDFMKSNPVRKQVALKNAEKTLVKIKHMLQCYAFARPNVRVSMRVLKAKSEAGNWVYGPKSDANAEDVVLKIAGIRCASQCVWSVIEDHGFTVQAFLPKIDADASKCGSLGCFFSVDSRPVSSSRGTSKQLAKIFREMLKKANSSFENVKDPFIYLQLSCPPASYDANVEPAKDDVLFEDPEVVINLSRRLFSAVYKIDDEMNLGQNRTADATVPTDAGRSDAYGTVSPATQAALDQLSNDIESEPLDIDQALPTPFASSSERFDERAQQIDDSQLAPKAFRFNMYGCDEEDLDLIDARPVTGRTETAFEELRQARKDVNLSNPWIIAKLKAPTKRAQHLQGEDQMKVHVTEANNEPSTSRSRPAIDLEAPGLPTPRPSSPSPLHSSFQPSNHVPTGRLARDGRLVGSQTLPPPQQVIAAPSFQPPASENEPPQNMLRQAPMYDYTFSSQITESTPGTALNDIPHAPRRRRQVNHDEQTGAFKPPARYQDWRERRTANRADKKSLRPSRDTAGLVVQGELGDLIEDPRPLTPPMRNHDKRDFVTSLDLTADNSVAALIESRNYPPKRRANSFDSVLGRMAESGDENRPITSGMLSGRGFIPASELAALEARTGLLDNDRSESAKRRKTGDGRALSEISPNEGGGDQNEHDACQRKDTRRTISRRRSTMGANKLRRTKSAQLPLERVPNGQAMQNVALAVSTSEQAIARLAGKIDEDLSIPAWKQPAVRMYDAFALKPSSDEISYLTASLRDLLVTRVSDGDMVGDLEAFVSNAFDAHIYDGGETGST